MVLNLSTPLCINIAEHISLLTFLPDMTKLQHFALTINMIYMTVHVRYIFYVWSLPIFGCLMICGVKYTIICTLDDELLRVSADELDDVVMLSADTGSPI